MVMLGTETKLRSSEMLADMEYRAEGQVICDMDNKYLAQINIGEEIKIPGTLRTGHHHAL